PLPGRRGGCDGLRDNGLAPRTRSSRPIRAEASGRRPATGRPRRGPTAATSTDQSSLRLRLLRRSRLRPSRLAPPEDRCGPGTRPGSAPATPGREALAAADRVGQRVDGVGLQARGLVAGQGLELVADLDRVALDEGDRV